MSCRIDILTLFPEMLQHTLDTSILGRARRQGVVEFRVVNIRDFANGRHRVTDDTPYGGGEGMVMKVEPLVRAIEATRGDDGHVVLMTPQGRVCTQEVIRTLAAHSHLVLVCGHYEGIDERVRWGFIDEEISIGDYVLTGGELPALVVADAVVRLLPGALGNQRSAQNDSFSEGMLEHPQYTRPEEFRGLKVPPVLLSGDHAAIARWRRQQSLTRTRERRPDLFTRLQLSEEDQQLLPGESHERN